MATNDWISILETGFVRILVLEFDSIGVTVWPLITVSNKTSLQNQIQNLRDSDPEESNEAFGRAIRKWLL